MSSVQDISICLEARQWHEAREEKTLNDPLVSIMCNCLYSLDEMKLSNLPMEMRGQVSAAVGMVGNWVGGTVNGYSDRLVFGINALNRKFQQDLPDITIPYETILDVQFGRMLLFAKTVDLTTEFGLVRFRCTFRANDRLHAFISERVS